MREGRFALISPVTTSTLGRCVATIKWIPLERAICVKREIEASASLPPVIIKSANSSMIMTI